MSALSTPIVISDEKIYSLWLELAGWYGPDTTDLIAKTNYLLSLAEIGGDQGFDEPALWDIDPDLALVISDLIDAESLLDLGGCLDADHAV